MNFRKSIQLLAIIFIFLFIQSCKNDSSRDENAQINIIPADSYGVLKIDLGKLDKKTFSLDRIKRIAESVIPIKLDLSQYFNTIKESGLDLTGDLYVYANGIPGARRSYVAVSIGVKNYEAVKNTLNREAKPFIKVDDTKEQIVFKFDDYTAFIVDKDQLIFTYSEKNEFNDVVKLIEDIKNTTPEKSLVQTNPLVKAHLADDKDIVIWVDQQLAIKSIPIHHESNIEDLFKLLGWKDEGNQIFNTISFDEGKIEYTSTATVNDANKALLKKAFEKKGVSKKQIKRIPGESPAFISSLRVNMDEILSYLNKIKKTKDGRDISRMETELTNHYNLTLKDVFSAFSGELIFSFEDGKATPPTISTEYGYEMKIPGQPIINSCFIVGIENEPKYQELISLIEDNTPLKRDDDCYSDSHDSHISVCQSEKTIAINTSEKYKDLFYANKKSKLSKDIVEQMTSNSFYMRMDVSKFYQSMLALNPNEADQEFITPVLEGFSTVEASLSMQDNLEGKGIVTLTDKSKNSLTFILDKLEAIINDEKFGIKKQLLRL